MLITPHRCHATQIGHFVPPFLKGMLFSFLSPGKAAERLWLHQYSATSAGNLSRFYRKHPRSAAGNEPLLAHGHFKALWRLLVPTCCWAWSYFGAERGPAKGEQWSLKKHRLWLHQNSSLPDILPALISLKFKQRSTRKIHPDFQLEIEGGKLCLNSASAVKKNVLHVSINFLLSLKADFPTRSYRERHKK